MSPSDRIDAIEANIKSVIKDITGFGKWQIQDVESEVDSLRSSLEDALTELDWLRSEVDDAIAEASENEE